MLLSEQLMTVPYQINAYEPGRLVVNGDVFSSSVLISTKILRSWRPQNVADITLSDFNDCVEDGYEVLLIGTGQTQYFLPPELLVTLGVGYEIMDTLAACRTFNLLANEGRAVIAGLLV